MHDSDASSSWQAGKPADDAGASSWQAGKPADDAGADDDDASSWSEWLEPIAPDEEVVEMDEEKDEGTKTPLLDGYAVTATVKEEPADDAVTATVKHELLDETDDNIVKRVLAEAVCKTIGKGLLEVKQEMTQVVECCSLVIHIFIIAMRTLK